MTWVYWNSEPGLWTVGYYKPDGTREPESDHTTSESAAARVHWLNGGTAPGISPEERAEEAVREARE